MCLQFSKRKLSIHISLHLCHPCSCAGKTNVRTALAIPLRPVTIKLFSLVYAHMQATHFPQALFTTLLLNRIACVRPRLVNSNKIPLSPVPPGQASSVIYLYTCPLRVSTAQWLYHFTPDSGYSTCGGLLCRRLSDELGYCRQASCTSGEISTCELWPSLTPLTLFDRP